MLEPMTGAINCEQRCTIPEGVTLTDMPPSRHAWSDIVRCPNDGCERTFLVEKVAGGDSAEGAA